MKTLIVLLFLSNLQIANALDILKEPFKNGVYIIDGDTPIYDLDSIEKIQTKPSTNKLIVNTLVGNILDLWSEKNTPTLSYCISDDFDEKKEDIIQAMFEATKAWETYADVKFIYLEDQDIKCNEYNEMVTFDIRKVDIGFYLARAFFPSYPRLQRNLLVDKSSFRYPQSTLEGILKHELGHTLGFRHEHIHGDSTGACPENESFKPLTNYDKLSVMHYPQCGGDGDILDLKLSDNDKIGAGIAYPFH